MLRLVTWAIWRIIRKQWWTKYKTLFASALISMNIILWNERTYRIEQHYTVKLIKNRDNVSKYRFVCFWLIIRFMYWINSCIYCVVHLFAIHLIIMLFIHFLNIYQWNINCNYKSQYVLEANQSRVNQTYFYSLTQSFANRNARILYATWNIKLCTYSKIFYNFKYSWGIFENICFNLTWIFKTQIW